MHLEGKVCEVVDATGSGQGAVDRLVIVQSMFRICVLQGFLCHLNDTWHVKEECVELGSCLCL
jgi:hypothetical protein